MPPKRRVLFVVNDGAFFLSHRLPLAIGAREAGYEVHVAIPLDESAAQVRSHGFAAHHVALSRSGTSPHAEVEAIRGLVSLYRSQRFDLVHHVTAKPILYGGFAARIARVPAVVHAVSGLGHLFIADDARARALRQVVRAGTRIATGHPNCAVIVQNEEDRRAFGRAIATPRVVTIAGSGVDRARFRATPLPDGAPPIVLMASRLLWEKGVGEMVEAAERLRGRARFVLAGGLDPSSPSAVPRARVEAWARRGVIEWWGHRDDMPDVLAAARIVCLPSYREGMPKVLLEACAAGRPIVTTDVPGCRDVLRGGDHGVLVPVRDAASLARALGALLDDRDRAARLGANAARYATRYAVENVVAETLSLYRELLRSAPRAARARGAAPRPEPRRPLAAADRAPAR